MSFIGDCKISVFFILCEMAELASVACDPQRFAEIWKCITVLSTEKVLKSIDTLITSNFYFDCMEYLTVAVKTACAFIQKAIKEICKVELEHFCR